MFSQCKFQSFMGSFTLKSLNSCHPFHPKCKEVFGLQQDVESIEHCWHANIHSHIVNFIFLYFPQRSNLEIFIVATFDCIQMQMDIWKNSENVYKHFHPKLLILIFEHYFWQKFEAFTFRINHSYMFLCILDVNPNEQFCFFFLIMFPFLLFPLCDLRSLWFSYLSFILEDLCLTGYITICFFFSLSLSFWVWSLAYFYIPCYLLSCTHRYVWFHFFLLFSRISFSLFFFFLFDRKINWHSHSDRWSERRMCLNGLTEYLSYFFSLFDPLMLSTFPRF